MTQFRWLVVDGAGRRADCKSDASGVAELWFNLMHSLALSLAGWLTGWLSGFVCWLLWWCENKRIKIAACSPAGSQLAEVQPGFVG